MDISHYLEINDVLMGSMWKRRPLAEKDKHLISGQEKKSYPSGLGRIS